MKASRFLDELPAEPELYERWQLDDPGSGPALPAGTTPAAPPLNEARVVPALFGEGAARPSARPAVHVEPTTEEVPVLEATGTGGEDDDGVPF
jgi:DNA helicase-2/ATP-dependent DNA helicase PcrA